MFNRSAFNNGKFNTSAGAVTSSSALIQMESDMTVSASSKLNARANEAIANMSVEVTATKILSATPDVMDLECLSSATLIRKLRSTAVTAEMVMDAEALSFSAFGFEHIKLNGINLKPGQELRIDTNDMTVEVDGQNAIMFLTSDFFNIKPGENIINYIDNASSRSTQMRLLWKDRWL